MIYILTALYIEAKPLIEKFNLKKNNEFNKFQVFSSKEICLIISGVGRINSSVALTYLISKTEIKENDFILNIGFAGTLNKDINLKDILIINKITNPYNEKSNYLEILYKNNFKEASLLTFDKVIENKGDCGDKSPATGEPSILVDMEGFAFYESAKIFFKRDKIIILKIVSDIIIKEENKEREILDFKNSDFNEIYSEIFSFIENLLNIFPKDSNLFTEAEKKYIEKIGEKLKFSQTMKLEFLNIMKYYKLSDKNIIEFLKNYENIEIKNKNEGKRYFENIKKRIIDW